MFAWSEHGQGLPWTHCLPQGLSALVETLSVLRRGHATPILSPVLCGNFSTPEPPFQKYTQACRSPCLHLHHLAHGNRLWFGSVSLREEGTPCPHLPPPESKLQEDQHTRSGESQQGFIYRQLQVRCFLGSVCLPWSYLVSGFLSPASSLRLSGGWR